MSSLFKTPKVPAPPPPPPPVPEVELPAQPQSASRAMRADARRRRAGSSLFRNRGLSAGGARLGASSGTETA